MMGIFPCEQTLERADLLYVIRAPLEAYPPSLHQVALFLESGLKVLVLDLHHKNYDKYEFSKQELIQRIHADQHFLAIDDQPYSIFVRLFRYLKFNWTVKRVIHACSPTVVIACDPLAIKSVGCLWNRRVHPKLVWHFHELNTRETPGAGLLGREAIRFSIQNVQNADLVIFPDRFRRDFFRKSSKSFKSLTVFNCPRRIERLPQGILRKSLVAKGFSVNASIVLFQGWIGPSRCVDKVIEGIPAWPENSLFVLVGPVDEDYKSYLVSVAERFGVLDQLHFVGMVQYQELNSYTIDADVGISIVSPSAEDNLSWRFSAGAVNKRFEYMSMGVPQVANTGPGMEDIIDGVGLLVDPDDSNSICEAIRRLLESSDMREEMGRKARQMHLERFCYEVQMAAFTDHVNNWCSR